MRISIIAAALACAGTAYASPTGVTRGVLERVDNGHATLTFVLGTQSPEPTEIARLIDVPVGMTPTALTVSIGGREPARSQSFEPGIGEAQYAAIVAKIKDPALLEYVGPGRASLHVFPVSHGMEATVVIELTATSLAEVNKLERLGPTLAFVAAPDLSRATWERIAYREGIAPRVDDERLERL
jgi:hypothetical protein